MSADCPVCAGAKGREWWRSETHRIVHCDSCTLMFADPLQEDASEYDADYYESGHHVDNPHRAALFEERYHEVFADHPPGRILDIGCGTGDFLLVCRRQGWQTVGIDVSRYAAETTARRTEGEAHAGRLSDVNLPEASFDAVHMHHVLEHVADPVGTLRHVRSLLRPGGLLVIEVPNERNFINLVCRIHRKPMVPSDLPPTHLLFFDARSLRDTVQRAGFEVTRSVCKDLTTPARRDIYRYFDGQGNIVSRTAEFLHSHGVPARFGQGVFLLLVARRPVEEESA